MSDVHPSEAEGRTPLSDEQQAMTGAWLLREEAGCVAYCMRCDQRAAWKSDERKAAMYAAADAIERLGARSPAPSDDADVINAIIEVLYDGDSPNVTDVEAAARHNPANMARCYAKILSIISAHGIAGLEADALDTLQSSRALLPPEKT